MSLPTHTDNVHTSPSTKDKYSKTFPPSYQSGGDDSSERKTKRQTVVEQLKQSKALSISRENSSDSLMNKSEENLLSSSSRKSLVADQGQEFGGMNKEEYVRYAIDEGLISTDDILKMALKMSKRKSSADIQSPMKAFNTEDSQRLDDSLNDSGSSFKRELSFSKIPVFKGGKPFESSNESIDIPPSSKERSSQKGTHKSHSKDPTRLDSPPKRVQRKSSQRKNDERLHKGLRKRVDSSESESCSPQVSPCNTSSGMSLGGTTGYAINPARDLGPRIAHFILPMKGKGGSDWSYSWIPVIGPIIGGALAALLFLQLPF